MALLRIAGRPLSGKSILKECHSCWSFLGGGDRLCLPYEMHQTRTSPSNEVTTTTDLLLVAWVAWHTGETCSENFNNAEITVCPEADVWLFTCNTAVHVSAVQYHSLLALLPSYTDTVRENAMPKNSWGDNRDRSKDLLSSNRQSHWRIIRKAAGWNIYIYMYYIQDVS